MTHPSRENPVWLIGTGLMGREYARVLQAQQVPFIAIGRGEDNCRTFTEQTGAEAVSGGLEGFLRSKGGAAATHAIVATGIETLAETAEMLIRSGVRHILLEKPGVAYPAEMDGLCAAAEKHGTEVLIAYNRRFYASVRHARACIAAEGGVRSLHFEFTEWSHVIATLQKHPAEHENWFLGNSTHVIDTAFFLAGRPKERCSFHQGGIPWHPASSVYAGAGITELGALFSYTANWEGPGRWSIDVITPLHRYIFRPMESLQVQRIGSVAVEPVEIDDSLDKQYKPGLYLQTEAFLSHSFADMVTLAEQRMLVREHYCAMSGYAWA